MEQQTSEKTLDVRDYLRPIWRHKWLIAALVVAVTAATYTYYNGQPRQYATSTQVFLQPSAASSAVTGASASQFSDRDIANLARLLTTRPVAVRVAKQIGYTGDPIGLLGAVRVIPDVGSNFVTISATSGDPVLTAKLANGFAKAFIDQQFETSRQQLRDALSAAQRQYDGIPPAQRKEAAATALLARIQGFQALLSVAVGDIQQLDTAPIPGAPFAPHPRNNATFAFALSLLFGILAAYALDRLDSRIRKADSVEDLYGAPMLTAVPRARHVSAGDHGRDFAAGALAEPFRTLRTTLELAAPDARVIVVTSALPREGKSTVVQNLALAFREAGRRVVVVEADMRHPTLAESFGVDATPGLTEVLAKEVSLEEAVRDVEVDFSGMDVLEAAMTNGHGPAHTGGLGLLTAGRPAPNPATLLSTSSFGRAVEELKERYDFVLIDSAPLLPVSDTLSILPVADGALIVSRVGETTDDAAERVSELISRVPHVRVLGVVANAVATSTMSYGYGHYPRQPA
jgi:Mrp family chromosome partitioning ATPase/capsular polysaccharide biosynthesis protein